MERAWRDFVGQTIKESAAMIHELVEEVDVNPSSAPRAYPCRLLIILTYFNEAMPQNEHGLLVEVIQRWFSAFTQA